VPSKNPEFYEMEIDIRVNNYLSPPQMFNIKYSANTMSILFQSYINSSYKRKCTYLYIKDMLIKNSKLR
jgi:hypothetical protein